MYRVVRVDVVGPSRGTVTPILENLPGFPDNITRDADGRFWVALFAPRKAILDRLAMRPALRRVIIRIPSALQPKPSRYAHLIAIDETGRVLDDRQDPTGGYAPVTDVLATDRWLYLGSLSEPTLARVPR
jgi:strictosidine synthase